MPHQSRKPRPHAQQRIRADISPSHWLPALVVASITVTLPTQARALALADNLGQTTNVSFSVGDGTVLEFWEAQKFQTTNESVIRSITAKLVRLPTQTGTATFEIWSASGNNPLSKVADAFTADIASLQTTPTDYRVSNLAINLQQNTAYFLVAKASTGKSFSWASTNSVSGFGFSPPVRARSGNSGTSWQNTTDDTISQSYFQLGINDVPGPLPILGASAAFGWSRRLRRRLKSSASAASPSSRPC